MDLSHFETILWSAHPIPQLTTPVICHLPSTRHTSGPPESPWHASIPPSKYPAQILSFLSLWPSISEQSSRFTNGTVATCKWAFELVPSVLPHPKIQWSTILWILTHQKRHKLEILSDRYQFLVQYWWMALVNMLVELLGTRGTHFSLL